MKIVHYFIGTFGRRYGVEVICNLTETFEGTIHVVQY